QVKPRQGHHSEQCYCDGKHHDRDATFRGNFYQSTHVCGSPLVYSDAGRLVLAALISASSAFITDTFDPSFRPVCPTRTRRSPSARPSSISIRVPWTYPVLTGRR